MTAKINQPNFSRRTALATAGALGALGAVVAAGTGAKAAPGAKAPKPVLTFRPDGKFKVVQFNDTRTTSRQTAAPSS